MLSGRQTNSLLWVQPLSGTDGPSMDGASILFSSVTFIIISSLLVLLCTFFIHEVRKGYRAFLALGPGGTPSTFVGYLRICVLRIFALRNPLNPPSLPPYLYPQTGILKGLPKRSGPRPKIAGLAPQRQMTQRGSPAMYSALVAEIQGFSLQHPDSLFLGTSCFEKHSTGLFSIPILQG